MFKGENLLEKSQKKCKIFAGGKIALIPQDPMTSLNPLYTIGDQLLEIINIHQHLYGEEAEKAIEALEAVQIPSAKSRFNNYPHEFSGGMKQRAIIARSTCLQRGNPNCRRADNRIRCDNSSPNNALIKRN